MLKPTFNSFRNNSGSDRSNWFVSEIDLEQRQEDESDCGTAIKNQSTDYHGQDSEPEVTYIKYKDPVKAFEDTLKLLENF